MTTAVRPPLPVRVLLCLWMVVVLSLGFWSWSSGGIAFDMMRTDWDAATKVRRLQEFFAERGLWAPLLYVIFVTVEVVVAPLPGLILYAPGGLIFGPVLGGALALAGNMLGAGLACGLARSFGGARVDQFLSHPSRRHIQSGLETHGSRLIFWLRLNPLTSTDLVSYAAGFTRIPIKQVVMATGLGIAPLCFAQSALSDSIFNAFPQLIYPLLAVCAAYMLVAIALLRRWLRAPSA